ncbi:4-hydroxybenzoate polyprenyltransferase domain protein [Necator americanus]|uniref:4-hydroxybenzoate polyprenyltransferase domain protein n=1 Tax=Necator americanus TaxID=51031 RepID=W2TDE0_NECAM|nr:4-hydroxybenzoate polyprenyltransferase domain protein [Necator americanus]ETN79614.1 4-hydroxybenzoate polyprenyltransferase domain protein [Necator americanus]
MITITLHLKVERTKLRPLACGSLNDRQAISLLAALLSASFAVLLQLNWFSVAVGSASTVLVVSYPLAKRFTYWPQFVLGATLNWGVLIAWAEMLPQDKFYTVFPLYFSTVLHTVIYDTIYSHQITEGSSRECRRNFIQISASATAEPLKRLMKF